MDHVWHAHRVLEYQAGNAHSSVDSDAESVYGVVDVPSLRNIE